MKYRFIFFFRSFLTDAESDISEEHAEESSQSVELSRCNDEQCAESHTEESNQSVESTHENNGYEKMLVHIHKQGRHYVRYLLPEFKTLNFCFQCFKFEFLLIYFGRLHGF